MSFDMSSLNSALNAFHQNVMEIFAPLMERIDTISALQFLQPYRHCLPYIVMGLGLLLLLMLVRAMRRKSSRSGRKIKSGKAGKRIPPSGASFKTPIRGRALDDMSSFDRLSSYSEAASGVILTRGTEPSQGMAPDQETDSAQQPSPISPEAPAEKSEPNSFSLNPNASPSPTQPPVQAPEEAPLVIAAPPVAPIPVVPPAAAPIAPPAGPLQAPEPPKTTPASNLLSPLDADFQRIYIEMYIDRELTTNFSALRANVNAKLAVGAPTEPLMPTGSANPEESIFAYLALAALDDLQSKESHLESGILTPHGQELCTIFDYALNRLRGSGKLSEDTAKQLLQQALDKLRSTPGTSS